MRFVCHFQSINYACNDVKQCSELSSIDKKEEELTTSRLRATLAHPSVDLFTQVTHNSLEVSCRY